MKEVQLSLSLLARIKKLYEEMESSYDNVASQLEFGCQDCPDNCCDSYFLHHTYAEWSYLWAGFRQLPEEKQQDILERSENYVKGCREAQVKGEHPRMMCPLNEDGLCILYPYRLMVCRTHGVPASMTRPDGQQLTFPGCYYCQKIVDNRYADGEEPPRMERTRLLRELVMIENDLFAGRRHLYPKVKLTIAEMLLKGAPTIASPHCER